MARLTLTLLFTITSHCNDYPQGAQREEIRSEIGHTSVVMPSATRHAELGVAFEELKLEGEDESFEVEVPNFHFDWGVVTEDKATEKKTNSVISSVRGGQGWSPAIDNLNTPPSGPARTSSPALSSASSGHLLGLTDASTVSGSSLVPTPPYASLGRGYLPRISGGSDESKQSERIRRFQRVVSAPVARSSNGMKENESGELDESVSIGRVDVSS